MKKKLPFNAESLMYIEKLYGFTDESLKMVSKPVPKRRSLFYDEQRGLKKDFKGESKADRCKSE
jgi:hypothetical protein